MKIIKLILKLLILIIICFTIFLIYKKTDNHNINYTSIGDGFSLGIDSYGKSDYGYSDYLKIYLSSNNKLNKYTKAFSKKDMTIETLYNYILINKKIEENGKEINIREVLRDSDIITLSVGLNDLLLQLSVNNISPNSDKTLIISNIEKSFNDLILEIKKYYHNDIYVVGYYSADILTYEQEDLILSLNNIYKNNANVQYIDISQIFKVHENYLSNPNSLYPNILGYKAIAREILLKIDKKA